MPKATPSPTPNPSEAAPLRWGVLATGGIARKFATDLRASVAGQIVACGSRTIEGARAFASEFGVPRALGSYGELARDPEVEVVYVATPHPFHRQDALACLRNKKAVLCEKPMTMNAVQTAQLFAAAEEQGVFLMEGLWTLFLPALIQARRWISDGLIGEPRLVQADFGFPVPFDPKNRWYDPGLGGGALLDLGVYVLALTQAVAGNKPPKVKASARRAPTGVDESTSILLDWSNLRAHLSCSIGHRLTNTALIHGTRGTITIPEFWKATSAILENSEGRTEFADARTTAGYDFEARAVTRAIREGRHEDPLVSKAFSLRLAQTMDTVRKQIGLFYPDE